MDKENKTQIDISQIQHFDGHLKARDFGYD
jgi:hypothetical protein